MIPERQQFLKSHIRYMNKIRDRLIGLSIVFIVISATVVWVASTGGIVQ